MCAGPAFMHKNLSCTFHFLAARTHKKGICSPPPLCLSSHLVKVCNLRKYNFCYFCCSRNEVLNNERHSHLLVNISITKWQQMRHPGPGFKLTTIEDAHQPPGPETINRYRQNSAIRAGIGSDMSILRMFLQ